MAVRRVEEQISVSRSEVPGRRELVAYCIESHTTGQDSHYHNSTALRRAVVAAFNSQE